MKVKQAYDDFSESRVQVECLDQSLTVVSSQEESDINTIVRKFGLTGQLPKDLAVPEYADFENIYDYHSAMNVVAAARDAFMEMPADVRFRFDNDPQRFLEFTSDPINFKEMKALGLLVPDAVDPNIELVVPAKVVTPPPV